MAKRPRTSRGRFTSWGALRRAKLPELERAVTSLAAALVRVTPRPRYETDGGLYSRGVMFGTKRSPRYVLWQTLIAILYDADLDKVPRGDRTRYHVCGVDEEGRLLPLSKAYASAELALGEAIETLESGAVMSPKDGDVAPGQGMVWQGIVVNVFLRKDAMR